MGINVRKRESQIRLHLGVKKRTRTLRGAAHIPGMRYGKYCQELVSEIRNQEETLCQRGVQFLPRWNTLSQDVQQKILEQLPISDLLNARLAGLDGETPQLRDTVRKLMRKRCSQLRPLWEEWKNSSRLKSREYRHGCNPVQFTTVRSFGACHCSISSMKHLWHIRDLKHLKIRFCPLFKPQLQDVNDALRGCTGLLRLNLSSYPYQHFPESILSLKKLRYLDLSKSLMVKQLPDDMGERLPQLRFLDLSYCIWITHIPESILVRLETHREQTILSGRRLNHSSLGLEGCDSDKKQKLVPAHKYPLLAASISSI